MANCDSSAKYISTQQGNLMVIAAIVIVVFALLAITSRQFFISSTLTSTQQQAAIQALSIANSGLEHGGLLLRSPNITTPIRQTCLALFDNQNIANGSVTVSGGNRTFAVSTLTNLASDNLTLSNASGFENQGRVYIGREAIDYQRKSGNQLLAITRGVDGTLSTSHVNGSPVAQYQCDQQATGQTPTVNAQGKRHVQSSVTLHDVWAVGNDVGNNFTFYRWNFPTEMAWQDYSLNTSNHNDLYGVSMINFGDGFAVGLEANNAFNLLRWLGQSNTWVAAPVSAIASNSYITDLYAVSAIDSHHAYAVGERSTFFFFFRRHTILHWDGTSWCLLGPGGNGCSSIGIPNASFSTPNLLGVSVINNSGTPFGFAVGESGEILRFDGSDWDNIASPTTADLRGVSVVSVSEAWAVGESGRISRWNGSSWSNVSSPTSTQLNSVHMIDTNGDGVANIGWAVGQNGRALRYIRAEGAPGVGSWSIINIPDNNDYNGVTIINANDAWAVGESGHRAHWDGNQWTVTNTSGQTLRAVSANTPNKQPISAWREIFS